MILVSQHACPRDCGGLQFDLGVSFNPRGVATRALMKLLGHDSMATSQRYVDGAGTQNRAAAAQNPLYGLIDQSREP